MLNLRVKPHLYSFNSSRDLSVHSKGQTEELA